MGNRIDCLGGKTGVAVEMTKALFQCPSLNALESEGVLMLQNLPSIAAGHALNVQPGDTVLDMCAAPGGKTTLLASCLQGRGKVVAVDRSQRKIDNIRNNSQLMSIESNLVECLVADSTKLPEDRPDLVESFDKVLLDGPCSALGQRPQLSNTMKMKELLSFPKIQKKLFHAAVRLLKSGGTIVYSTCTITRGENEEMVKWAMEKFGDHIEMAPLFENAAECTMRYGSPFYDQEQQSCDKDTIGFFMAKFQKK